MELKAAFGLALKSLRTSRQLTQEDFETVSSRTYLSTLERGLKSPTLEKVDALASVLKVHPLTLLVDCYLRADSGVTLGDLLQRIESELQ
jgi:transcriptional regulator with XRE-family HTH domain